ncbi:MAG TPA: YfhO family protein, partial [Thermoanaerobaculia bacterium]|nr:YfhO family protein [Thermoanaerobaculia bacterium]
AWDWRLLPRGERAHFYPRTAFMERLAAERDEERGTRVTGHELLVYPSILAFYGLDEARPYNPLAPQRQVEALAAAFDYRRQVDHYFSPLRNLEHPFLDFLAVSAVVSNAYLPRPAGFARIDGGEALPQPFELLGNPGALPRWFLASGAEAVAPAELAAWIEGMTDPRRVALSPAEATTIPAPLAGGEVRRTGGRPGRVELEVAAEGPALLATSIPGPAGWRVTADGARLRPFAVHGAYLGALLPAGTRRVELRFLPPGLVPGSALALAAALILVLDRRRLRRREDDGR